MKDRESEQDRTEAHVVFPEGTVVAHYTIVRRIGMGAMGDVYLAEDSKLKLTSISELAAEKRDSLSSGGAETPAPPVHAQ